MSRLVLILCIAAFPISIDAKAPHPATLDLLVMELGSDDLERSKRAENQLASLARTHPEAVDEWLRGRLDGEPNPLIKSRLKRVLSGIEQMQPLKEQSTQGNVGPVSLAPYGRPVTRITFTKENFNNNVWEIQGDPPQVSSYRFNDGVLEIHSTKAEKEGLSFVHRFEKPKLEERQRFVLDAEIKVIKERHVRPGLAGVHLNLEDGRTSAGLMILEDGIFAYRHSHIHRMDTTDGWHHYRFVIEGEDQWIFVDDMKTPVITLKRGTGKGRHWATFGDGTAGAGAIAQFRNVSVSRHEADVRG